MVRIELAKLLLVKNRGPFIRLSLASRQRKIHGFGGFDSRLISPMGVRSSNAMGTCYIII